MILIDTHSHLFAEQFNEDRSKVIEAAIGQGVQKMYLPNIDSSTTKAMLELSAAYPENCFPMMGIHPSSIKADYEATTEPPAWKT